MTRIFGAFGIFAVVAVMSAVMGTAGAQQQTKLPWQTPSPQAGEPKPPPAVDTSHPRAKLVLGADELRGRVEIVEPRFRKLGVLTQAQVKIRNTTSDRFVLEYKFDWEDEDGFEVGGRTVWHRITLTGNQIEALQSMGKTPQAKNITFTLRFPHDPTIK